MGLNYHYQPDGSVTSYEDDALEITPRLKNARLIRHDVWKEIKRIVTLFEKAGHGCDHAILTVGDDRHLVNVSSQTAFEKSIYDLPDSYFEGKMSKQQVFDAITKEREHQDDKWGAHRATSLAAFLLIMESELAEAKFGWMKDLPGKSAPLNEIVQLAAVCVACLEKYGTTGNTAPKTNDVVFPQRPTDIP